MLEQLEAGLGPPAVEPDGAEANFHSRMLRNAAPLAAGCARTFREDLSSGLFSRARAERGFPRGLLHRLEKRRDPGNALPSPTATPGQAAVVYFWKNSPFALLPPHRLPPPYPP